MPDILAGCLAMAVIALLAAGCGARVEVVDAVSGAPVAAEIVRLDGGRLLVNANGYESWSGPASAHIALHPLWQTRFAGEHVAPRRPPPAPCVRCP